MGVVMSGNNFRLVMLPSRIDRTSNSPLRGDPARQRTAKHSLQGALSCELEDVNIAPNIRGHCSNSFIVTS